MSLIKSIRVRASQGSQYIKELQTATPEGFRGRPAIADNPCADGCTACRDACPTAAIGLQPLTIDLGRCVFCAACTEVCPEGTITFTSETKMASDDRKDLIVQVGHAAPRVPRSDALSRVFGRSLKLRQVSAGGCNGCELELNAVANVNFDLQRYGVEWVASPRHADALVITGPLTRNMKEAVRLAWEAMPDPRFVVAVGACAISGGLYDGADGVDRAFLDSVGPSVYVPGCPPHPLTFVKAILNLLEIR